MNEGESQQRFSGCLYITQTSVHSLYTHTDTHTIQYISWQASIRMHKTDSTFTYSLQ